MMRTSCSRVFHLVSLNFVAGLLVAADSPNPAPPQALAKDTAKSLDTEYRELLREYAQLRKPRKDEARLAEPDPTKPRYVKTEDSDLLRFAEVYLNHRSVNSYIMSCRSQKDDVDVVRRELEDYKREEKPEAAVIRYLERKVRKQQEELRGLLNTYKVRKQDLAEYNKSGRVPIWIVEQYEKKRRDESKPSRP